MPGMDMNSTRSDQSRTQTPNDLPIRHSHSFRLNRTSHHRLRFGESAGRLSSCSVASLPVPGSEWCGTRDTAEDAKAEARCRHLLVKPLGANEAVQVALLNNPDLQATFEEIGISQADLVQAGLLKNPTFAASWRFPDVAPGITDAEYSVAEDFLDRS